MFGKKKSVFRKHFLVIFNCFHLFQKVVLKNKYTNMEND